MSLPELTMVDTTLAAEWVKASLEQGSDFARQMKSRLPELPVAVVIGASESQVYALDDHGRGIRAAEADKIVERCFASWYEAGCDALIVEDDLARRNDTGLPNEVFFLKDRVLRRESLLNSLSASQLLRSGSSGYPLNAFICRLGALMSRLDVYHDLSSEEIAKLRENVSGIVVSIFDAETYLLVMTSELASVQL